MNAAHPFQCLASGASFLACVASSCSALETDIPAAISPIDYQLEGQLDFRDTSFRQCFEQHHCTIGGTTISAYRRASEDAEWMPARIYWDPIDGLGVLDGGQDDEIDYNERLIVELQSAGNFAGVWLTDLFTGETPRYVPQAGDPSEQTADEDQEDAIVQLFRAGQLVEKLLVSGNQSLPHQSFNHVLAPSIFDIGGDLRRRLIIADGQAHLMLTERDGTGQVQLRHVPLGQLDQKKRDLFGNGPDDSQTAELLEHYSADLEVDLFVDYSSNARRLSNLLDDPDRLTHLNTAASVRRQWSDRSNGEVSVKFEQPLVIDRLEFSSSLRTSNDFSVAGLFFFETPR